jgi:hypothetical protein
MTKQLNLPNVTKIKVKRSKVKPDWLPLKLEVRAEHMDGTTHYVGKDGTFVGSVCPVVTDEYWLARVRVSSSNAIVCFFKFGTIGVGFQKEERDWNTNLPYRESPEAIYDHIAKNKGPGATEEICINAIRMIQNFAEVHMNKLKEARDGKRSA